MPTPPTANCWSADVPAARSEAPPRSVSPTAQRPTTVTGPWPFAPVASQPQGPARPSRHAKTRKERGTPEAISPQIDQKRPRYVRATVFWPSVLSAGAAGTTLVQERPPRQQGFGERVEPNDMVVL